MKFRLRNLRSDHLTAFFCWLTLILLHFPGYVATDMMLQVRFANVLRYGIPAETVYDYHPIIVSIILALLGGSQLSVGLLFVFHQTLFWVGLYLLSVCFFPASRNKRVAFLVAIGLFPPLCGMAGAVIKDVAMTSALTFVAGLTLYLRQRRLVFKHSRKGSLLWIVNAIVFFYGVTVRINGFLAVLPLVLLFDTDKFEEKISPFQWLLWAKRLAKWTGILVGCFLINQVFTYGVLRVSRGYLTQQFYLHDIVGISVRIHKNLVPSEFFWEPPYTLEKLEKMYEPSSCMYLFAPIKRPVSEILKETRDKASVKNLRDLWIKSILQNPKEYLDHRLTLATHFFHLPGHEVCWPIFNDTVENPFHISARSGLLQSAYFQAVGALSQGWLFRGIVYLVLSSLLVVIWLFSRVFLRKNPKFLVSCVPFGFALSAWLYSSTQLLIGIGCDFRYHHWSIMACLLSLVAWLSEGFRNQATRVESPTPLSSVASNIQ